MVDMDNTTLIEDTGAASGKTNVETGVRDEGTANISFNNIMITPRFPVAAVTEEFSTATGSAY